MKTVGYLTLMIILLTSCKPSIDSKITSTQSDDIHSGEPFELGYREIATISDINLHIRFDEVQEDSRCPTKVTCVWSGLARVAISVWSDGSQSTQLELDTINIPSTNSSVQKYLKYQIELKTLEPYPEYPEKAISQSDYRLTLIVTKGD
jgi:hypothetical protein